MSSAFARALTRIVQEGRYTASEMADVAGCSERHLYAVADSTSTSELHIEKAEKLSRYLSEYGEIRPALGMLSPHWVILRRESGTADGCVKDEILRIVDAAAGIRTAHSKRDRDAMKQEIDYLRGIIADLEAEVSALE
jgi:hypothetical protein